MSFSTQDSDEVLSEMNVTPLVDVMLVLLVVFIVTTPMMTNAIKINLPKTDAVASAQKKDPVVVSVDQDGKFYLAKNEVAPELLEKSLQDVKAQDPEVRVQLQADEGVNYGQVAKAMASIEKAGITFRLTVPHKAFNRQIGALAGVRVSPDGRPLSEQEWLTRKNEWLASDDDRNFVASLMKPCLEPGKFAGWIAPPVMGINRQPVDFEYVKF